MTSRIPRTHCIKVRFSTDDTSSRINRAVQAPHITGRIYTVVLLLDSAKRRMTKGIQGMRDIPYKLKPLNLHFYESRRLRGDLIEVFQWYSIQEEHNKEEKQSHEDQ